MTDTTVSEHTRMNGPTDGPVFIFAHGAGADMDHAFMETVACGLAERGIRVIRFNFPYMIRKNLEARKFPPDRAPKLIAAFETAIGEYAAQGAVIGGKSMGGRIASLLDGNPLVRGIACLGFPFHPPGKPEKMKGEHLAGSEKPCLILQGERDTFGCREEVAAMTLSPQIQVVYIPDGDHSFKPRKSSGYTEPENLAFVVEQLSQFIWRISHEK
ncbi:alpha/beta family hydrolase [Vibrio mangrovi]|uniref:Alpha/beta family hydrolase n=1 Tax=Vibrio mangrovi TaxID=474394 RepID=A0A1Y6ISQ8_9VIBR|nr:alpha/beta family hydrolase [Vibrio mangrovi]MDW6003370.1 alpha/beta family hydrolase [Vibrio mangrovi]SMR99840.1 Alpha/beta hydrolase family protein [Vibrio mangrovi]